VDCIQGGRAVAASECAGQTRPDTILNIELNVTAMRSRSVDCIQGGRAVSASECAGQTRPATILNIELIF
jgi:hypothetical protein